MYGKAVGVAAGTLPSTGGMVLFPEQIWWFVGGFALMAAGGAVLRLVPRREE